MKFAAVLLFSVIWFTFCYLPIAHMVWGEGGYLLDKGALDFAGGTVVHINAGIAGLVGAYMLGKRIGYGREAHAAALAAADHGRRRAAVGGLVRLQRRLQPGGQRGRGPGLRQHLVRHRRGGAGLVPGRGADQGQGLDAGRRLGSGGRAGGDHAGLRLGRPDGRIVIGAASGFICLWGVNGLKRMLGADDSLDVFGVHGVGGIVGALLTGVFSAPFLGGTGGEDFSVVGQVIVQAEGVIITVVWSAVVAFIAYKIVDLAIGLRVSEEDEREGLDIAAHGESAYSK
jgi:ammonium transporter, Amt family